MSQLELIETHLPLMLLVVFRLGGLMVYGPIFGSPVIPVRIKILLSFFIGITIYPLLSTQHFTGVELTLDVWTLAPLILLEMFIGLAIGFAASLPLVGVQTGGLVMGQQMGLGFAQFYNPAVDDEADVVGQMLFFMGLAGFLLIGGHEAMVLGVLHSFEHVPPGSVLLDTSVITLLTGLLMAAYELALRVAAPLLALIFLQSIAMGFISKTVPQLNILSLGFPLRILVGFLIVALGLVIINELMMDAMDFMVIWTFNWIESLGE